MHATYHYPELDLPGRLKANKPDFDYTLERFQYVTALPDLIGAQNKDLVLDGYAPIRAVTLRSLIGDDYHKYLGWLVRNHIFDPDNIRGFVQGKRSMGYKLNDDLVGLVPTERFDLRGDADLIEKLNNRRRTPFHAMKRLKHGWVFSWLEERNRFVFDAQGAETALLNQYEQDLVAFNDPLVPPPLGKNAKAHPKYRLRQGIMAIGNLWFGDYIPFVDPTGHRLHSAITILPKPCRPFLKWNKETLVSYDVKNSQPFILLRLFQSSFYSSKLGREMFPLSVRKEALAWLAEGGLGDWEPRTGNLTCIPCATTDNPYVNQDFTWFYEMVVSGLLYDGLQDLTNEHLGTRPNRDEMKRAVMLTLFSQNRFMGGAKGAAKRLFKQLLPYVFELTKILKRVDHAQLAITLQRIESDVILNKVAKRIERKDRDAPLLTVHDSCVMPASCEPFAAAMLEEEFTKAVGCTPRLEIENWVPKTVTDPAA